MNTATTARTAIGMLAVAASLLAMAAGVHGQTTATATTCRTAQLKAGHGFSNGAAGSLVTPLRLRNVSHRTCWLKGYPRITLLDRHGRALRPNVPRTGGVEVRQSGGVVRTVHLAPGHAAEAALRTGLSTRLWRF